MHVEKNSSVDDFDTVRFCTVLFVKAPRPRKLVVEIREVAPDALFCCRCPVPFGEYCCRAPCRAPLLLRPSLAEHEGKAGLL